MSDPELQLAVARLRAHGGYEWLLSGPDVLLATDIAEHLKTMGVPVKSNTITLWLKELSSAQDFGRIGVAASRADIIKMLASRFVSKQSVNE